MILELVAFIVLLFVVWNFSSRPKNFPPGPWGFPLLGHLPLLGPKSHETLIKWKKSYGPVIGIWFGSYRTVVIQDTKLIKEALNLNTFSGRPPLNFTTARSDGVAKGVVFTDGQEWTEQRRFALRNLRDFGFGTKTMEGKVQEEVTVLLDRLEANEGKPMEVQNVFNAAMVNALWSIMFGERLDPEDPEIRDIVTRITANFRNISVFASLAIFMPWINKISPTLSGYVKMMEEATPLNNFINRRIDQHNANYVPEQPRDYVDAYTDEVKKTKDPNSSFHPERGVMPFALLDLFEAGSETTSTTLAWICVYLIHHPRVQEKLQEEIDEVVGKERLPSLGDRPSMPYTEAVISETMRYSSVAAMNFHSTTEDLEFHGFFIPKDTMIITNSYSAHFDEAVWGDPQVFRPGRFLHEDGKFKKNESLMPFSTGKRVCIGESLARDELFLFSTALLQRFVVSSAGKLPSLEPHLGVTLSPKPFEIILKRR